MITSITALHGMLGEPADWDFLPGGIGPEFPIEAPDLWHKRWDVDLSEIGDFINAQTSGDILLGYSMGGRLALHALTENPKRWRAAVVISANPGLPEPERRVRLAADQTWSQKARQENWPEFLEAWNSQPIFSGAPTPDRSHLESRRESIARAFDRWSLGRQEDLLFHFPHITTPVLWMTGEQDQKFTGLATAACSALPNATRCIIPHAGHRPHLENRPYFLSALRSFLD